MRKLFIVPLGLVLLVLNPAPAQPAPSPEELITALKERFRRIEDYSVTVRITVQMPRLRMPRKKVRLFFKSARGEQPDRVKIEADGFAVVPRTGLTRSPDDIFKALSDLEVTGSEDLEGRVHWIIQGRIIPDSITFRFWNQEEGADLSMRLWVDPLRGVIARSETYLDTIPVLSINSTHREEEGGIHLPELTEVRLHLGGGILQQIGDHDPMGGPFGERHQRVERESEQDYPVQDFGDTVMQEKEQLLTNRFEQETGMDFEGYIRMEFSKYKVNRGLKDSFFEDKKLFR